MNAADFVLEGVAKGVELLELLEHYAPAQRDRAWHMEECFVDVQSYVGNLFWETPECVALQRRGQWSELFEAQKEWVERFMSTNPEPSDEQMCYDDCLYPRARNLIDSAQSAAAPPVPPR